jgi:uncharacterized protein (TIGR03437 family)
LAGTFGRVVAIGGESSDLALDESRGVLYVANFTANRIDVISLSDYTLETSISVAPQPSSLAISSDAHYLLITHFGNFASPATSANALTLIDLTSNGKQTFALGNPPVGVAFGIDGKALVVTATDYLLFDPTSGTSQHLDTIAGVAAKTLPVPPANFPPQITTASLVASGDGETIYGMAGSTSTITFKYDVASKKVNPGGIVTSTGLLGPRVVSANSDASLIMAGWVMIDANGTFVNYFPQHTNQVNVGTTLFDSGRGLLYSQIPQKNGEPPVLTISDVDNLTVREQLKLPENTAGKSVLSSDGSTMYAVSDSGILVLPIGSLSNAHRLVVSQSDLMFRGSLCDRRVTTQQITISDVSGGNIPFSIAASSPGVSVAPSSATTPAVIRVSVDPNAFQNQNGTSVATLSFQSAAALNVMPKARVLVNAKSPEQRGTIVDVPGNLVDILPDPLRNRFFILRQDRNSVLVFDGSNYMQVGTLRTGNLPSSMAITVDGRYLLVGNSGSQIVNVYDMETLDQLDPIRLPSGHIALSLACSNSAILAATEYYDGTHHIIRLDLASRTGFQPPSLGVFQNLTPNDVALVASPNGSTIMAVASDGSVLLYDATQDTFTVSRKDFSALSGAYAASIYNQYVVGNNVLNASLVPMMQFESATGSSSGFAFLDQVGFRTTAPASAGSASNAPAPSGPSSNPGVIQRVDLTTTDGSVSRATMIAEAPLMGSSGINASAFSRTLAPLSNQNAIVNLTISGFTVLAWNYDASVAPPHIGSIVNAADSGSGIAPGGLISLLGEQLSPINLATKDIPVPTALADSCLTVNGSPVPLLFVSPKQINAQMPFEAVGEVTMVLRTPGGVSDTFNLRIPPNAPGVFRAAVQGLDSTVPTIVRSTNGELVTPSNPVHKGDTLTIYLTGMGQTTPAIASGLPGPSNPLATTTITPQVALGGTQLPLSFAGLAPGQVGVYQINVKVPSNVPAGLTVPLTINQNTASTTVSVRVVD